jgi:hypothetical protein
MGYGLANEGIRSRHLRNIIGFVSNQVNLMQSLAVKPPSDCLINAAETGQIRTETNFSGNPDTGVDAPSLIVSTS